MNIRPYTKSDLAKILELHKQSGLDYTMPPMDEFFSRQIVDDGEIGMAAFMSLNVETYLVCNPNWRTPAWRMEAIRQLTLVCNENARAVGAKEALAFLPPPVEKKFGPRLVKMGWYPNRPDWHCYQKRVE